MNKYNLIILKNQGFCFGVTSAINKVYEKITDLPKPIYLLGDLVHNKNVSNNLIKKGIIILNDKSRFEMLDEINSGSVIISAHGVSDRVYEKIKDKNLNFYDATCPFVKKASIIINKYLKLDYDVIYIGKKHHPETEAFENIPNVHIIESEDDINNLIINNQKIAVTNQTTLSILDIDYLYKILKNIYPNIVTINAVCNATKERQLELIAAIEKLNDEMALVIVIGDRMSNNTESLAKRARAYNNIKTLKIENKNDLISNLDYIKNFKNIIIASGASTPKDIIDDIIYELKMNLNI